MVGRHLYRLSRSLEPTGPMRRGRPPQLEAPPPSSASSSPLSPQSPLVHTLSTKMVECLHLNTLTLVMVLEPQGLPLPAGRLAPPPQVSLPSLLPASLPLSPHALHTCPLLLATTKEESSPPFPFLLLICAIYIPTTNKYVSKPTT